MKNRSLMFILGLVCSLGLLAGCELKGSVEQGRCVALEDGKSFTIVTETLDNGKRFYKADAKLLTFKMPVSDRDRGPKPDVGGLLYVDVKNKSVLVFDTAAKQVREFKMPEDPKVQEKVDAKQVKGKKFPDTSVAGFVTVYLPREKSLVTFKIPAEAAGLDASIWKYGDDLRVAFLTASKDQALRYMNCTKTSIYKRK